MGRLTSVFIIHIDDFLQPVVSNWRGDCYSAESRNYFGHSETTFEADLTIYLVINCQYNVQSIPIRVVI